MCCFIIDKLMLGLCELHPCTYALKTLKNMKDVTLHKYLEEL